jgi:hypothetical protein
MRAPSFVLSLTLLLAAGAAAQDRITFPRGELRPLIGTHVPSNDNSAILRPALALGAQAAFELNPHAHFVASGIRAMSNSKLPLPDPGIGIYQYDLGLELNLDRAAGALWRFKPFAAAGYGARTYDYDAAGLDNDTFASGYLSGGVEFQRGTLGFRIESRTFLSGYREPTAGRRWTSSADFAFMAGLAWHLQ